MLVDGPSLPLPSALHLPQEQPSKDKTEPAHTGHLWSVVTKEIYPMVTAQTAVVLYYFQADFS